MVDNIMNMKNPIFHIKQLCTKLIYRGMRKLCDETNNLTTNDVTEPFSQSEFFLKTELWLNLTQKFISFITNYRLKILRKNNCLHKGLFQKALLMYFKFCREHNIKWNDEVALFFVFRFGHRHSFSDHSLGVTGLYDVVNWNTQHSSV